MGKPNVVIIYCDDLGYGDLSCYGSMDIQTPHLDQLAKDGVRFTKWYSNSPVCSPSRASLLTGLYPGKTGVNDILGGKKDASGLPDSKTTLAKILKNAGYDTALIGKWHLGMDEKSSPNSHGFNQFYGFKSGCVDYYSHILYWIQSKGLNPLHDLWDNDKEVWRNGEYMTEIITEKTVEFIETCTEQPFFAYAAYNAPHYPMHAPKKYMDRFSHLSWDRQVMGAMISAMDDGVGDIISTLKRKGCYEDTVIFFSSDNGPSTESRNWLDGTDDLYYGGDAGIFRGHKGSLFEGGIREPAILCYPAKVSGGQTCEQIGMMMDIVPTMMEFTRLNEEGHIELDGKSILPMVMRNEESQHKKLFWEYNGQLAVRYGKWKLVLDGKLDMERNYSDAVFLADLEQDPGEKLNLCDQFPELVKQLTIDLKNWYEETCP